MNVSNQKGSVFASALLKVKPDHAEAALLVLETLQRNQSQVFYEHLTPGIPDEYAKRSLWAPSRDQISVIVASRIWTLVSHIVVVDETK